PGSGRVRTPTPSEPTPGSGRVPTPSTAAPGSGRYAVPTPIGPTPGSGRIPAGEPVSGRTMLGYAAPPLPARATTSTPFPPATTLPPDERGDDELPVPAMPPERRPEPPADPLSEMVLEGFRTGPIQIPGEEDEQ